MEAVRGAITTEETKVGGYSAADAMEVTEIMRARGGSITADAAGAGGCNAVEAAVTGGCWFPMVQISLVRDQCLRSEASSAGVV